MHNSSTLSTRADSSDILESDQTGRRQNIWAVFLFCFFALSLSFRHSFSHISIGLLFLTLLSTGRLKYISFPGTFAILGLVAWQLLSQVFGPYPGEMLKGGGITYHWLLIPIIAAMAQNPKHWYLFSRWWFIGLIFAFILCVVQFLVGVDKELGPWRVSLEGDQFGRVTGFQYRTWIMSFLFGLGAVFFCGLRNDECFYKQRWVRILAIIMCLVGLVLTQNRGILVALIAASLWQILPRYKWKGVSILIVCACISLLVISIMRPKVFDNLGTLSGRTVIWDTSIGVIKDSPVFGVGRDHFQEHYIESWNPSDDKDWPKRLRMKIGHTHSDYVGLASYYGIAAALFYILFLCKFSFDVLRARGSNGHWSYVAMSVVTYLAVASITENYLDHSTSFYACISCLVLCWTMINHDSSEHD